jgi:acyl carrier protein
MHPKILALLLEAIDAANPLLEQPVDVSRGADSALYGPGGVIDSLGLVSIIVELEQLVERDLGATLHLADVSDLPAEAEPFATLGSMAAYVQARLAAARVALSEAVA